MVVGQTQGHSGKHLHLRCISREKPVGVRCEVRKREVKKDTKIFSTGYIIGAY